jgi:nicotinamidase-related amidase
VRAASELGFDTFIIEDACAAWSPEIHKNTLVSFEMMFGSVITNDEVIEKVKENL